jgi:hypothetical protein
VFLANLEADLDGVGHLAAAHRGAGWRFRAIGFRGVGRLRSALEIVTPWTPECSWPARIMVHSVPAKLPLRSGDLPLSDPQERPPRRARTGLRTVISTPWI